MLTYGLRLGVVGDFGVIDCQYAQKNHRDTTAHIPTTAPITPNRC